jgi:phosphosulfolactate synthase
LIRACRQRGRVVQVGGEVMHSTIRSPRPLRSEVADIALLVAQGVDGISLSGETAVGHDPVGAVRMLDRVVRRAERALDEARPAPLVPCDAGSDVAEAVRVSAARGASPILVSAHADEVNWLNCSWGVAPQPHRRRVINSMAKAWEGILDYPLKNRTAKPRTAGTTFLSLKGVGLAGTRDLIQVAGDYIDRAKLAFGTTLLLEEDFLREQIRLFCEADIEVNPGGTSGEIALHQDRYPQYLARARELGFTTIEVSDGTVEMDDATRERLIKSSLDAGFKVVSEVGKKDPELTLPIAESIRQIQRDLRYGASYVTIESRASAKGVGVFDADGKVKADDVEAIANAVDPHRLIWEAPTTEGQLFFIRRFGPNVNLGNIAPTDIIPLEGQRRGLRGDTFRMVAYQPDQLEAMLNAERALFAH